MFIDKNELLNICKWELGSAFNKVNKFKILHHKIIIEKRATIAITPKIAPIRPNQETYIPNFFLAGDWTSTGLPATLEGAAISGKLAAGKIMMK